MDKDTTIFILRIIGGIGTLLVAWEIRALRKEIKKIIDQEYVNRITRKVYLFFGLFGILKIIAIILDSIGANGMAGALVNNILVFWLVRYCDRQRQRLKHNELDSGARGKISTTILELVDEMKMHRERIAQELNS